jgi:general secretion pathway protein C
MLKRYFWLAYVVMVTLAAMFAADIVTSYLRVQLATPVSIQSAPNTSTTRHEAQPASTNYRIIAERNIFNANPPKQGQEPPPPAAPVAQPTQPTQLQLKLAGTVAGANKQRYAILEDTANRGAQAVYQVGDVVQNAVIVEINPVCVVFDRGGQRESLCFQYDAKGRQEPPTPAARAAAAPLPPDDSGILRVDASTWRVSRELILEHFANLGGLSAQARVMPYVVQGQTQGFRLVQLKNDSLLQKIGLQNGDVIQKVNGLNITTPGEALQAFQQLSSESSVRLELLRSRRSTTLTYELR